MGTHYLQMDNLLNDIKGGGMEMLPKLDHGHSFFDGLSFLENTNHLDIKKALAL